MPQRAALESPFVLVLGAAERAVPTMGFGWREADVLGMTGLVAEIT
jgi:hypothetical protein